MRNLLRYTTPLIDIETRDGETSDLRKLIVACYRGQHAFKYISTRRFIVPTDL